MNRSHAISALFGAAWLAAEIAAAQSGAPAAAPPVAPATSAGTAPVERREDGDISVLVQAGQETTLSSQTAGKIRRIHYGLGDQVKAGARLLEFDCSEQQAQLQAADAEYRGARETHLSRLRLQALGAAGELEVTLAAAAAEKARSQVELRRSQLAYCGVTAPFAGRVTRLRVKVAESVPAGYALLDLVNPASLKAQLFVPTSWVNWIKPNLAFEVKIKETGRSYRARVSKLNARIEGVSQQLEVEGRIEGNTDGLLPGMVGVAVFPDRPTR
jgi:membrane fusion protein (multidrug efflux system)